MATPNGVAVLEMNLYNPYATLAPTTAAICIMLMVWPSWMLRRSVTLPDLLVEKVLRKIGSNLASATMYLPAFSALPFSVLVWRPAPLM